MDGSTVGDRALTRDCSLARCRFWQHRWGSYSGRKPPEVDLPKEPGAHGRIEDFHSLLCMKVCVDGLRS